MTSWQLTKILLALEEAGLPEYEAILKYEGLVPTQIRYKKACLNISPVHDNYIIYVPFQGHFVQENIYKSLPEAIQKLKELTGSSDE